MTLFAGQDIMAQQLTGTGAVFNEPAIMGITSNGL
jgi:hypothetical protein